LSPTATSFGSAAVRQKLVQSTNVNGGGDLGEKIRGPPLFYYLLVTPYII
jgi:hypothetical protein